MRKKGWKNHAKRQVCRRAVGISTPVLLPLLQGCLTSVFMGLREVYEVLQGGEKKVEECKYKGKSTSLVSMVFT